MKHIVIIFALLLLMSCGEQKISVEEKGKCIEAIKETEISMIVQNFYVDDYGYLCCVISPTELIDSPDATAEDTYSFCCQPPLRGVKILNLDGETIGKFKK